MGIIKIKKNKKDCYLIVKRKTGKKEIAEFFHGTAKEILKKANNLIKEGYILI